MPEGLRIVVDADTTKAEQALKSFSGKAEDAGQAVAGSLGDAFDELKKKGLVSIASIGAAMTELRQKIELATDPEDIRKFNTALTFLATEQKKLKDTGLPEHLEGVSRGSIRAGNATQNLARVFQLFPPEVSHLTHSFDQLLLSYESIRSSSDTSGQAFKKLGEAMIGPVGIGIAISAVIGLLEAFGGELFNSKEATEASEAALKNFEGELDRVKKSVTGLTSALQFANELGAINIKVRGQGELLNLSEQSVGQAQLIEDLKHQRDIAREIEAKTLTDFSLNAADMEKAKKTAADAYAEIDEKVTEAQRKQTLIQREIALQRVEDQKKADDEAKKAGEKFVADTIAEAKKLATFLDKNTQFNVKFEVDPSDTTGQTFKKALEFIDKTKEFFNKQSAKDGVFTFKPLVAIEPKFIPDAKFFKLIRDQAGDVATLTFKEAKTEFEKNIERLAKENPVLIQFQVTQDAAAKAGAKQDAKDAFDQGLFGITPEPKDANGDPLFTAAELNARRFAKTVTGILKPAFADLFAAIRAGQDPLEAFFSAIKTSIQDLVQKLLSAAAEALILSAIFPGGVGGVKGFGNIFKGLLGFAGGGVVTGPTLAMIGEGAGTSLSNPEVVAPLDKLKGILSSSGGGGNVRVTVTGRLRGKDQVLQNARTTRSQRVV